MTNAIKSFFIILILRAIERTTSLGNNNGCIHPNLKEEVGILGQVICSQIPTYELSAALTALKVRGEIPKIRKELFEPNKHILNLDLSNCNVSEIEPLSLSVLGELQVLSLSNNSIDFITEDSFSNLTTLKELYLDGNGIKVIIEGSFKKLNSLKTLNLASNKLFELPGELPSSLIKLNLMNNEIDRFSMERLNNLGHLEMLLVCGNGIHNWPEVDNFPMLKTLCIGDKVTASSTNSSNLLKIESLSLSARQLNTSRMFKSLSERISSLITLQSVYLENYEIRSFGFLTKLRNLKNLNLQNIDFTAEEVKVFPSNLTTLTIYDSPYLANCLLKSSHNFEGLKTLNLKNNHINTISSYQYDMLIISLASLDISLNPLSCNVGEWDWVFDKIKNNSEFLRNKDNTICHEPLVMRNRKFIEVLHLENRINNRKPHEIKECTFANNSTDGHQERDKTELYFGIIISFAVILPFLVFISVCKRIIYNYEKRNIRLSEQQLQCHVLPANKIRNV